MHTSKMKYLKVLIIASLLIVSYQATAQNINVVMKAPERVAADERFQLVVTVNGNPTGYSEPNLDDFDVLWTSNQSYENRILDERGRLVTQISYSEIYLLQPKKSGKFTISPAQFEIKGKKYTSNSVTIEVTGNKQPASSPAQAAPATPSPREMPESGDLFLKIFLDKSTAYVGEFITATVKLYTRYNIDRVSELSLPSFDGFYFQNMEIQPDRQLRNEVVNGKAYGTAVVRKFILIPQKAGELTIGSGSMVILTDGGFFSAGSQLKAESRPLRVNIKPLPARPASFTGAVGKLNMQVNYDKSKVNANDPVILKITLSGAGNMKLIEAPKINFPEGIDAGEPASTNNLNEADGAISGTRQFEYLLIPRAPGKITLPHIEFSFFDPVANQYKTLSSPPHTLEVLPSAGNNTVTGTAISREDLKFLGRDIEFIRLGNLKLKKSGTKLFGSVLFYSAYIVPLLLFILVLVLRRNYIRQNANTAMTRNRKAQKYAVKRLKIAREYLAQSKKENFYEEVLKALWGYLSDKLNIPVADLSRDTAREQLVLAGVDQESVNRIMTLIDTCEFARYAPASSDNTMADDYREAVAIITRIQERIR